VVGITTMDEGKIVFVEPHGFYTSILLVATSSTQ